MGRWATAYPFFKHITYMNNNIFLDGQGSFNHNTKNAGTIKWGEFNNAAVNTGSIVLSAVFTGSSVNSGTIGDLMPVYTVSVFQANSGNWESTYTTVLNNSSFWAGTSSNSQPMADVSSLTGNWESTYTLMNAKSATWDASSSAGVDLTVRGLTGNWESTYTLMNAKSATWDASSSAGVDLTVRGLTGNWESTYTTVNANSANWSYNGSDLKTLSGNWQSTYSIVNTNSANWNYQGNDLKALSGNWQSTYMTVNTGGNINGSLSAHSLSAANIHGSLNAKINTYSTPGTTLSISDAGAIVKINFTSLSGNILIPTEASAGWIPGTQIILIQWGTKTASIVGNAGVTVSSFSSLKTTKGQYCAITLGYLGSNVWILGGNLQ